MSGLVDSSPNLFVRKAETRIGKQLIASARDIGSPNPAVRLNGFQATSCILFAKSRPEVGGGSDLPS